MSIERMAVVLHHSIASGSDKLVLLGIANHDGDGGAWPSVGTLARYANLSERAVRYSLKRLVESGELEVERQAGGNEDTRPDRRPNRYRVHVDCPSNCSGGTQHRLRGEADFMPESDGVKPTSQRGEAGFHNGVKPTAAEPSLEPSKKRISQRQSKMAEDWQPDPANWERIVTTIKGIDHATELENFRDHWLSKDERRADWNASLRNWMRNAKAWQKVNPADPPKNPTRLVGPNGYTFCQDCNTPWEHHTEDACIMMQEAMNG
jgi:hypothetical protein